MRSSRWLGRDKLQCILLKEKGSCAEEKVSEFVMQSHRKRVVLVLSYEVRKSPRFPPDVPSLRRHTQREPRGTSRLRRGTSSQIFRGKRHRSQSRGISLQAARAADGHAAAERHGRFTVFVVAHRNCSHLRSS